MKKRIIFATGNTNKMKEIREILSGLGMEILSMKEAGICVDIEENGTTFEENAMIKAIALAAVFTAVFCSGKLRPKALRPNTTTIFLFAIIVPSFLLFHRCIMYFIMTHKAESGKRK